MDTLGGGERAEGAVTWAKVDDRLYDDPRFEVAGLAAMGLFLGALSYMGAYHTDGWISLARCRRIAGAQHGKRLAEALVRAGFWEVPTGAEPETFRLVGWEASLIPAEEVEARSARASEAGRKGGLARAERQRSAPRSGVRSDQGQHQDPPPTPEPCPGSFFGKSSEALETPQPTRAPDPDPIPIPTRSGAHGGARDVDHADWDLVEDLVDSPSSMRADETPAAASRVRSKKAAKGSADEKPTELRKPRAEVYVELFVAGLSDAGRTITRPRTSEGQQIGRIAKAHAKRGGVPIVGVELDAWIRSTARDFARATPDPAHHRGGLSPFGMGTWLDAGKPVQRGGVAPELPRKPLHNLPLPEPPKPLLPPPGWDGKPKFLSEKPKREPFPWELSDEALDDLAIAKGLMKPEDRYL